ncbi:MAG: hypothetical protein ACK5Q2_11405, partial [Bacteroidota bacterium]
IRPSSSKEKRNSPSPNGVFTLKLYDGAKFLSQYSENARSPPGKLALVKDEVSVCADNWLAKKQSNGSRTAIIGMSLFLISMAESAAKLPL